MLRNELDFNIDKSIFWTDSMAVLRYIGNENSRFHTFVANRITVIREVTEVKQWRYVGTKVNPADCASRGLTMKTLISTPQWFRGPEFLWNSPEQWPDQSQVNHSMQDEDPEVKHVNSTVEVVNPTFERLFTHFSSWYRLLQIVGWLLVLKLTLKHWVSESKETEKEIRFKNLSKGTEDEQLNAKMKELKQRRLSRGKGVTKCLTTEDIKAAEREVIQYVQSKSYPSEIEALTGIKGTEELPKSSSLQKLDPFVLDGILRVGGRLERSKSSFGSKHPIVLPKNSPVSRLIIEDAHSSVGHLGKNAILAHVRQKYWIVGANSIIKKMLSKCSICKRYQSRPLTQKMANLPSDRLKPDDPPFTRVGLDYFGPIEIRRGRSNVKRYGVVFTCLASRAVHLEVAASLDTDSCIQAIRRFVARRGPVKMINQTTAQI